MEDEIKNIFESAIKNGYSAEEIKNNLIGGGFDPKLVSSALSEIETKKKSPSQKGLEELKSKSEEKFFASDISSNQPREAAVELYNAVVKGNLTDSVIASNPERYNSLYNVYRQTSSDPAVRSLPSSLFDENGNVDSAAFSRLRRDSFRQLQYQIDQDRKTYEEREEEIAKRQKSRVPVISPLIDGAESILGGIINLAGEVSGSETLSDAGSYLLEDVQLGTVAGLRSSGLTDEEINKGFLTNVMEGNIGTGLTILGPQLLQQIPQLALIAATGGTAGIAVLGASSAGSALESVEKRKDMTAQEKMLYGVGAGLAEALSERLFMGDIRMLRQALGKAGAQNLSKEEIKQSLFASVPQSVRSTLEEGVEEAVASVVQQGLLNVIAGDEIDPIEVAEGAIIGSIMGGSTYLLSKGMGALGSSATIKERAEIKKQVDDIEKSINDPETSEVEKDKLTDLLDEVNNRKRDIEAMDAAFYSQMTEQDRLELYTLNNNLLREARNYNKFKDKTLKQRSLDEIKRIKESINEIENRYDREEEVGVPSPVAEGEAPIETQPVEGTGQETPEAGGVLQVPVEEGPEEVAPTAVEEAPVAEEVKATVPQSNRQFEEEKKQLEQEIVRLMDAETDEISRVRGAIREVQGTDKLATLDGAMVNEGTIERISQYYEPLIENLNDQLRDLLKSSKPEAPVQKPYAEQTDDERIQRLMLDSFKNKAFPAIPSIELKSGKFTNVPLGTTEQELASALERGEVPTNDGVIKISDIQSVTGDGRRFEREEVAPVEDPVIESQITGEDFLFRSEELSNEYLLNQIINKAIYVLNPQNSNASRLAWIRKYVDPNFVSNSEIKIDMAERLSYAVGDNLFSINKKDYGKLVDGLKKLGIEDVNTFIKDTAKEIYQPDEYENLISSIRNAKPSTKQELPVAEVVTPTVEPTQEAVPTVSDEERQILSDIQVDEDRIENIKEEIELEKGNIKEELDRLKGEIANVRAQKLPADEKRDLIDDLKAQMEDAKDAHDDLIEIYKDDIKALQSDIKKAQKKLAKIRQAPAQQQAEPAKEPSPMEARTETAVKTDADGNAFIMKDDFIAEFPALHSFFSSGEIFRRERGATETRVKYLRDNAKYVDWLKQAVRIRVDSAKDFLVMMSSYKPRTQKDVERFNQAYIESERFLAQMMAAQKNDAIFKTKAQVIAVIRRQASLTPAQKEVMTKVIQSLNSEQLFNINFKGEKDFYQFNTNLFKANNGYTIIHEIGHWGYYNILSAQERLDFMNYMANKFMDGETDGLVYPMFGNAINAKDSYQEYFANQFDQWYTNQVGAEGVLKKMFEKLGKLVDQLINAFKEVGYNKDLTMFFERIADTTKYGMNKAKIDAIDSQLNEDLNTGGDYIGTPSVSLESISDPEKESELDTEQETVKDKFKKAFEKTILSDKNKKTWRSMWWSDEQRQVRVYKETLTSMLNREAMTITEFASRLDNLLSGADSDTVALVSNIMDGTITPEQRSVLESKKDGKLIFGLTNAMRNYIDSFSESIVSSEAFTKLSKEMQETIIENIGTYLRGTYRFWKDKRFMPSEKTIKAAIEDVYNTMYNDKFNELQKLFKVEKVRSNIAELSELYEQIRENVIEEERKLPAGEKTAEIKALIANLDDVGKKLNSERKLADKQKKLMKSLTGSEEMTPENIKLFVDQKNDYISKEINKLAPEIKEEAKDFVNAYLEEAKKIRERDDFKGLGMISPSSIKIPSKPFSRRKNLPETIKALLGEEKDPIIRFVDTAVSLSNIKYKGEMVSKIATQFSGTDFIKNKASKSDIASGKYRIVSDKFSPLNGKYVHTDIFEAIVDPEIYSAETAWLQTYFNILLLGRKTKVIYNLPTWRKNLTGGWYTMMANGVINPEFFKDMNRRTQLLLSRRADPETEAFLDIMAKEGLLGQGVDANLIGAVNVMYKRAATGTDLEYLTSMQRLGEKVKGFDTRLGNKYASVDDYTKLVVFRSEIKSFAVKLFGKEYDSLTDAQKDTVHKQAAERVKQSTPTFSRLPPFYYKLARMPLGDFLSFEFEAIRSFTANFKNGYTDIQTGINDKTLSPEQKAEYIKSGTRRLMGTAAVFGARAAVPTILAGIALGDDDELEEDVKTLRPNWMEGHSIIPTAIGKDGTATVYDYSMEDPYGTIFDVVTDPLSFPSHALNMLNPNMAITFLFNLSESKDVYGRDIVNSYDSGFTKAYKYSGYTLKSLVVPPFISSAVRDELRKAEAEAETYSPLDAVGRVASRAIIRDYKYDISSQLYFFGKEFSTKKEQYTDLSGISRGNRLAQLDDIRNMYLALNKIAMLKGNLNLIVEANKNIKRQFKPFEEAYILYGYEIPEQE
jgi:hypothetical protein